MPATTQLSTMATPGKPYGSFAGKVGVVLDPPSICLLGAFGISHALSGTFSNQIALDGTFDITHAMSGEWKECS